MTKHAWTTEDLITKAIMDEMLYQNADGESADDLTKLAVQHQSGVGTKLSLQILVTETLTADRALTIVVNNAARTINLTGNLTLGGNLSTVGAVTIAGAFALGITLSAAAVLTLTGNITMVGAYTLQATLTGNTTVTFPTSGTLLAQALAEASLFIGSAGAIATAQALSGDATIVADGTLTLGQVITGAKIANIANANVIGGGVVLHRIDIAAGANADTDVTLTHKTRVIDAWLVMTGAGVASAVLTVKNGANAISNGLDGTGSDKTVVRASTIDDAQYEIAALGTLRVTGSGGATQPAATVYVLGIRVA